MSPIEQMDLADLRNEIAALRRENARLVDIHNSWEALIEVTRKTFGDVLAVTHRLRESARVDAGELVTPTTKGKQMAEYTSVDSMGDLKMYAVYYGGLDSTGVFDKNLPVRILRVIGQVLQRNGELHYLVINPGSGRVPVVADALGAFIDYSLDCTGLLADELTNRPGTTAHVYIEALKNKTIK